MKLSYLDRVLLAFVNVTVSSYLQEDFEIYLKDVVEIQYLDYWERITIKDKCVYLLLTMKDNKKYILSKLDDNYLNISEKSFLYILSVKN